MRHAKTSSKNVWWGGNKDVQKVLVALKRPSKTVGRLLIAVSTPPPSQVKNVTMSERRKRAERPPRVSKSGLSRHSWPKRYITSYKLLLQNQSKNVCKKHLSKISLISKKHQTKKTIGSAICQRDSKTRMHSLAKAVKICHKKYHDWRKLQQSLSASFPKKSQKLRSWYLSKRRNQMYKVTECKVCRIN